MVLVLTDQIIYCFDVRDDTYDISSIDSGLINDTFLIESVRGATKYIMQRMNKHVFKHVDQILENIQVVNNRLGNAEDYWISHVVPTKENKLFHTDKQGSNWRMMHYVPNNVSFDKTTDPVIAFQAGKVIGYFHSILGDLPVDQLHVTIPHFHDLNFRVREFFVAIENATRHRLTNASDEISFAKRNRKVFDRLLELQIPLRITHNDTKLNNILFDKLSRKALCLIDLDTVMPGYVYCDYGDSLRTLACSASENETDLQEVKFNLELFEHFTRGYLSRATGFLTQREWESLPLSIQFMPFIMGLRFLTDYLNGNTYYKVQYQDHNLDKCKNQFALMIDVGKKHEKIEAFVQSFPRN